MKIEIINILFVLDKSKTNNKGYAPIRCRITYKGVRKVFSSGLLIKVENWNNSFQQANPPNKKNKFINSQLSLIKNEINQAFFVLQIKVLREIICN